MVIRSLLEIFIHSSSSGKDITLNCDECFLVMEYFVELALDGFTLDEIKKPLLKHIKHCPDCRDHHLGRLREMEEQWVQGPDGQKPV